MTTNVAPWVKETCITVGTGALVLSATSESYIRFNAAIAATETVYYAILDSNGNRESGIGTFDGVATIARTTVTATLNGTVYNDTSPTPLALTGSSVVICTFNEAAYDALVALIDQAHPDKQLVVTEASQLSGVLDPTIQYQLDGSIDMGTTSIIVPAGGVHISGLGTDISELFSTEPNYTMFTGTGVGNVFLEKFEIRVTGASSKVYDLSDSGAAALELSQVNYINCTSLGELNGFRQGLETNTSRFGGQPELTLTGTWTGGFLITTSIIRNLDAGAYSLFKAGVGFTMASRFKSNFNIDLPVGVSIADFVNANFPNPSTFQMQSVIASRNGVIDSDDPDFLPNIGVIDLASAFTNNIGLDNSYEGGRLKVTAEAPTVLGAINTFVDAAGTFTSSQLEHFNMNTNGLLQHEGISPEQYKLTLYATIAGTATDVITIKIVKWDSSLAQFVDVDSQTREINNSQSGTDLVYLGFSTPTKINQNDYVKIQVANTSAARNVTLKLGSLLIAEVR